MQKGRVSEMARTNKSQKYAIYWLAHTGKSADDIALELNINTENVLKILEKGFISAKNPEQSIQTSSKPVGKKSLMINETMGKKNNQVMIMTEQASMQHDSTRSKRNSKVVKTRYRENKNIFRPKQK
jgi:hypothetical protein